MIINNSETSDLTNKRIWHFLGIVAEFLCIVGGVLFLLWRARLGYSFNDEPFLLTLAHRLLQGDKLIFDEWHGTQLFGLIILPIFRVYLAIKGSTEGVLLFSRLCFCAIWFLTSICVYLTARKYSKYAILTYIFIILFAPFDYMTCSYISFGIVGTLFVGCLIAKIDMCTTNTFKAILYGVAMSMLVCFIVLCSPYMAIVYFLVLMICFFYVVRGKKKRYLIAIISNVLCTLSIGIFSFYAFSLKNNDAKEIFKRLAFVVADPEHSLGVFSKIVSTVGSVTKPMLVIYVIGLIIITVYCVSPKLRKYRKIICIYYSVSFVCSRFLIAKSVITGNLFNYEMFDFALLGIVAFLLLNRKPWKLFIGFSCIDTVYMFCTFAASNTGLMSISAALVPGGAVGIIYIALLAREIKEDVSVKQSCIVFAFVVAIFLGQIGLQLCVRMNRQFYDSRIIYLTQEIKYGAAKGLKTTPQTATKYEEEYVALKELLKMAGDTQKIFVNLIDNPIVYLDANMEYGTFSAWTFGYNDQLGERYKQYYEINPSKKPQLVFFDEEREELANLLFSTNYERYDYNGYYLLVEE